MRLRRQDGRGVGRYERKRPSPKPNFSYYSSGQKTAPAKTDRPVKLNNKPKIARLIPTIVAVAIILGSVLFSLTLSTNPVIDFVDDRQSPYRSSEEYSSKARSIIEAHFSSKTKLTINTKVIEDEIIAAFPEVSAARLRLPVLGRRPVLVLDVRSPAMIISTSARSFILDESGVAVAEMRQLSADKRSELLLLQDQTGLDIEVGKQAVTSSTVKFINQIKLQLKNADLSISQLVLPTVANELDIHINGLSYYVKTDTSADARLQAGSYLATKQHLDRQGITPKQYIDVRVEERVFYQ